MIDTDKLQAATRWMGALPRDQFDHILVLLEQASERDAKRVEAIGIGKAVAWLRTDENGRGIVDYRDCWNIAAMLERGDHLKK